MQINLFHHELLSERQIEILKMIPVDSKISAKAMSEKMSEKNTMNVRTNTMNVRTIERDIAILKKIGVLGRKGGRKDGEWVIMNKKR